jgi:large subunit ribosomal protein L3
MIKRTGLIGTKIGNSSYFDDSGKSLPVTILKIDECVVSDIKTKEKNGYISVQIASIDGKSEIKKVNKPQQKIFANLKINPKKVLKEFRVDLENILEIGSKINVSHFKKDQFVDVTSKSIGKGFAGAMKRHNFGGLRASHGVSVSHRSHGSTGQNQDPGKVFKGKKMAGHMGATQVTIQNLKVIEVDEENKILIIKGSIPGKKNSTIFIRDAVKKN